MRYVIVPPNVPMQSEKGAAVDYSFAAFLDGAVWTTVRKGAFHVFDGLTEKLGSAKADAVAALTDEEHEALALAIDAADMTGAVSRQLKSFIRAVKAAPRELPGVA
jgi:hypothetical protein